MCKIYIHPPFTSNLQRKAEGEGPTPRKKKLRLKTHKEISVVTDPPVQKLKEKVKDLKANGEFLNTIPIAGQQFNKVMVSLRLFQYKYSPPPLKIPVDHYLLFLKIPLYP